MGKREIKEQNKDLQINIVDLAAKFDPSKTGKYTNFLVKNLKQKLEVIKNKNNKKIRTVELENIYLGGFKYPSGENQLEDVIIDYLGEVYGRDNIETLYLFNDHLNNDRIPQGKRDINQYDNWESIAREVSMATIKQQQKLLEKEVSTVLNNDSWLVIRPLTFEASLTYGSGTKWCTASRNNKEYFYRYSGNGVLCYVINKKNGEKFGFYYDLNETEFSIWNAPDRRIDSMETGIPTEILSFVFNYMKMEKCNTFYFSEQEKEKYEKYYNDGPVAMIEPVGEMVEEDIDTDIDTEPYEYDENAIEENVSNIIQLRHISNTFNIGDV